MSVRVKLRLRSFNSWVVKGSDALLDGGDEFEEYVLASEGDWRKV
jgi:hypothetical protein